MTVSLFINAISQIGLKRSNGNLWAFPNHSTYWRCTSHYFFNFFQLSYDVKLQLKAFHKIRTQDCCWKAGFHVMEQNLTQILKPFFDQHSLSVPDFSWVCSIGGTPQCVLISSLLKTENRLVLLRLLLTMMIIRAHTPVVSCSVCLSATHDCCC